MFCKEIIIRMKSINGVWNQRSYRWMDIYLIVDAGGYNSATNFDQYDALLPATHFPV